jgi:hypothetical protein
MKLSLSFVQELLKLFSRKQSYVTNFMELSPSREADSCSAAQELPSILWNPKVHYLVHKSLPLLPILSHINSVHTIASYLSKIQFNIFHPVLVFLAGSFFRLPNQYPICIPLLHSRYMTCLYHPPWLDHSNYTWQRVQVMKLLIMQFSPTSCHFIPLRSKYSPQHPQSIFLP